jgi:hypothetical protein
MFQMARLSTPAALRNVQCATVVARAPQNPRSTAIPLLIGEFGVARVLLGRRRGVLQHLGHRSRMMKKRKRLQLSKETIKALGEHHARHVAGGVSENPSECYSDCATGCDTCYAGTACQCDTVWCPGGGGCTANTGCCTIQTGCPTIPSCAPETQCLGCPSITCNTLC